MDLQGDPSAVLYCPAVTRGRGLRAIHITLRRCVVDMCGFGVAIVAGWRWQLEPLHAVIRWGNEVAGQQAVPPEGGGVARRWGRRAPVGNLS